MRYELFFDDCLIGELRKYKRQENELKTGNNGKKGCYCIVKIAETDLKFKSKDGKSCICCLDDIDNVYLQVTGVL